MSDPMTLEETIACAESYVDHDDTFPSAVVHWLTTLRAQLDEKAGADGLGGMPNVVLPDRHPLRTERARLAAQIAKLREALDTAVNYNFTSDFRRAALVLLKETEPGDG